MEVEINAVTLLIFVLFMIHSSQKSILLEREGIFAVKILLASTSLHINKLVFPWDYLMRNFNMANTRLSILLVNFTHAV